MIAIHAAHQGLVAVNQDHVVHNHVAHLSVNQDILTTTAAINSNLHAIASMRNLKAEGVTPSASINKRKEESNLTKD